MKTNKLKNSINLKDPNLSCFFAMEEICQCLNLLKKNHLHYTWLKLIYTFGMTIAELLELKVGDIDLDKKLIQIKTSRNNNYRIVEIPSCLVNDLRSQICQKKEGEFLFIGRNGKVNPRTVQKLFEKIEKLTGLKVTINKIRKTTAVHLSMDGWSEKMICEYMGHVSLRSTRKMLKETESQKNKKIFPLEKILNSAA